MSVRRIVRSEKYPSENCPSGTCTSGQCLRRTVRRGNDRWGTVLEPASLMTIILISEAVVQRCSVKTVFLKILENSKENTCARVYFFLFRPYRLATLLKKRLWHRCFPVSFEKFLRTLFL